MRIDPWATRGYAVSADHAVRSARSALCWGSRAAASLVVAMCLAGCADPAVDAVVGWVSSVDDAEGNPAFEIYDGGRRYQLPLEIDIPGANTQGLGLEVDNRGRGFAVNGVLSTLFISLRDNRTSRLSRSDGDDIALSEDFSFTRNADAVVRGFDEFVEAERLLMPTTTALSGTVSKLALPGVSTSDYTWVAASDAPVMVWSELEVLSAAAVPVRFGRVLAYTYPSEFTGDVVPVEVPTLLGQIEISASYGALFSQSDVAISDKWCPGRVCIAPGGGSLTTMGPQACEILWWHWGDPEPRSILLPDACPTSFDRATLFMQLADDVVALSDEKRVYVADLTTLTVKSAPKLWDVAGRVLVARRGRAAVLVSADSQVVSIDAQGLRLLSTAYSPCRGETNVVTSPSGLWVLRGCNGSGLDLAAPVAEQDPEEPSVDLGPDATLGTILRISPLGLETFHGVPMTPLSIDDSGNGLLYSTDDLEPRGLFVLASDGSVSRVDPLEPEPAVVLGGDREPIYFAAQSMQR